MVKNTTGNTIGQSGQKVGGSLMVAPNQNGGGGIFPPPVGVLQQRKKNGMGPPTGLPPLTPLHDQVPPNGQAISPPASVDPRMKNVGHEDGGGASKSFKNPANEPNEEVSNGIGQNSG